MSHETAHPVLLGLDWGTSSLRAWLIDEFGQVVRDYHAPHGILNLPRGGFSEMLENIRAEYALKTHVPMIACGMIGSINGWTEVPYISCPATIDQFSSMLRYQRTDYGKLYIIPGLMSSSVVPDVMRGEETQIIGLMDNTLSCSDEALVVLPGTHSKWAEVRSDKICDFQTFMTGELFSVLMQNSILGRLSKNDKIDEEECNNAFLMGVKTALSGNSLSSRLFSVRTVVLCGKLDAAYASDYLSGLLIGDEIHAGMNVSARTSQQACFLVGEADLCRRYQRAFTALGYAEPHVTGNTAPLGLLRVAQASGLVPSGFGKAPERKGSVV